MRKPYLRKRDGIWYVGLSRYGFVSSADRDKQLWLPLGRNCRDVKAGLKVLLGGLASAGYNLERSPTFNPFPANYYGQSRRWRDS